MHAAALVEGKSAAATPDRVQVRTSLPLGLDVRIYAKLALVVGNPNDRLGEQAENRHNRCTVLDRNFVGLPRRSFLSSCAERVPSSCAPFPRPEERPTPSSVAQLGTLVLPPDQRPSPKLISRRNDNATGRNVMKTSLVIAALAAALITGSTASSQAIPAAPLSKSIQQNSSSLVEHVGYRGYRGYRGWACRRLPRLPRCRPVPRLPRRTGVYRPVTGVSAGTGLSAIAATVATGVSAYTGATAATAGAELPCIATAAAGEILHAPAMTEKDQLRLVEG